MKRQLMSISLIVVLLLTLLMGFQRVQANSALPAVLKDQGASGERDLQELLENEQLAAVQLSYHNALFYVDFFEILSSQVPLLDQYEVEYYGERLPASSVLMELAHYHSINPAVLISFLEVESGVLTNPERNSLELATGYDPEETYGFAAQISRLAESLNGYYHAAMFKDPTNAGSLAILQVLAEKEQKQYYYHLRNIPGDIQVGSYVARTTTLGYPSCEPAGSSTGVHLHFAFLYAGNGTPAHGKRLTGWTIYAGSAPYEGTMVKNGTVKTAMSSKIDGVNDIPNW